MTWTPMTMDDKKGSGGGGGGSQPGDITGRRRRRGVELPEGGAPRVRRGRQAERRRRGATRATPGV
jgi:hypothetical protein